MSGRPFFSNPAKASSNSNTVPVTAFPLMAPENLGCGRRVPSVDQRITTTMSASEASGICSWKCAVERSALRSQNVVFKLKCDVNSRFRRVTTRAAVSRSGLTSPGDEKKIVTVLSKPESYVNKAATGVIVQNSIFAMDPTFGNVNSRFLCRAGKIGRIDDSRGSAR
jgi:hypothetical protein